MGRSRTQVNKAHKSRFATKSSRAVHKIADNDKSKIGKGDRRKNALKGARAARIQHNKMVREQKRAVLLKEKRASSGTSTAPRIIVLFGLSHHAKVSSLAKDLLTVSFGEDGEIVSNTVASPVYKSRITVLETPHGDLLSCMELAKVADLLVFVVSANALYEADNIIDSFGFQCLSVFRAIGLPTSSVFIRDLPIDTKSKNDVKKACISSLAPELPEDCKFHLADSAEDLHKFMWLFKEQHLSAPHWRNQRPYLVSHEVGIEPDDQNPGISTLVLSGYVRAHSLSVNQLVHVSGAGDFQLERVDVLKDPFPLNERKDRNAMDSDDPSGLQVIRSLLPDPSNQEPLLVENIPDPLAGEQTWPTEAEMAEADANNKDRKLKMKRVPRGTSDYQAAWILDDTGDDGSEGSEEEGHGMVLDEGQKDTLEQEGLDSSDIDENTHTIQDFDVETMGDMEMHDDTNMTKEQIEAEIKKIKAENAEDEEFPDEVDTPLDVPARKRFAKYRGLKSFRTSSWDPKESLPPDYGRIFAFDNFIRTQKHVLARVNKCDLEGMNDCAPVGSYVRLHVRNVPTDAATRLCFASQKIPIVLCGLLQHESKMSVLHFSVKKNDAYDAPIKSKDTLVFLVGFRHFVARPLFSSDTLNSDKHKMERFLHPGCFSIASVYAPICFPPVPLIVLKHRTGEPPYVAATGSLRSVDPDRIILKKIILTGYPQKVSKSKAVVRFMFHNPDDVRWFKPVELWTKCGRRGRIKEPVGTHGAMKCIFNGVVQQHDTVCLSLYKRVYPRWPEQLHQVL